MTTLLVKNMSNNKTKLRIFYKVEELKKMLSLVYKEGDKYFFKETKKEDKKVIETIYMITGVGYDQNDDGIPLLIKSGLIKKEDVR